MMKSARDIFYSYPKLPVDAPMPMYVEVGEYEALQNLLLERVSASNDTMRELMDKNKLLMSILERWVDLYPYLQEECDCPELDKLITDAEAQLGTLGNPD